MSKTILIHSFRHGVGRSNIAANLAFLMAREGQRVAILDTNTKLPAVHLLFGLQEDDLKYSFNDYLMGSCDLNKAAYDLKPHLEARFKGELFLVPGNNNVHNPAHKLTHPQDVHLFNAGCQDLINILKLDVLLVDSHSGVSDTALVAITVSDILLIVLRLNPRDYQGTQVTMDIVRQLNIPKTVLIVNEAPAAFDLDEIKTKMEHTFDCEVVAVLPHVDEVMAMANKDIFALRYPEHQLSLRLQKAALSLML